MDHQEIKERSIAIRYLLGLLPVEERIQFEEHYIDCEACLDRMDLVEDCYVAMQRVAAEKATPSSAGLPARRPWLLARLRPRWQTALLLGAILLLVLSSLSVVEIRRLRQELNHMKEASGSAQTPPQPASQQPESTRVQLEKGLEKGPEKGPDMEPVPSLQPEVNTPIFALGSVRGAESGQEAPVNKIEIPSSSRWIVFSLELDDDPEYQTYSVVISTASGGSVWSESRLRPNHDGSLTVSFPAAFFQAGDYLLALEGLTAEKQFAPVASYPFRVIKENPLK